MLLRSFPTRRSSDLILPEACLKATSVDDFYTELLKADQYFNALKEKAKQENKAIRYIGKLEDGKVSIALEMVDESHPFFTLSGRSEEHTSELQSREK